jgi:transcriptional regulator with XRE-family HTH domain
MTDGDWDALRAFGLAVRRRRTKLGLSQEELAKQAGLHRTYVGAVERGERNVTLRSIQGLARALGIPASRLLVDAEHLQPQGKRD